LIVSKKMKTFLLELLVLFYVGYGTESPTMEPTLTPVNINDVNAPFYGWIYPRFILGNVSSNILVNIYNNINQYIPSINIAIKKGILTTVTNINNNSITNNDLDVNVLKFNDIRLHDSILRHNIPHNNIIYINTNISCISAMHCIYILYALRDNNSSLSLLNTIEHELQLSLNDTNLYFTANRDHLYNLVVYQWKSPPHSHYYWIYLIFAGLVILLGLCIGYLCFKQYRCCRPRIKRRKRNSNGYNNINSNDISSSNIDNSTDHDQDEQKELL